MNAFEMWTVVGPLWSLCGEFTTKYVSEKILKIGQYLMQSPVYDTNVVTYFFIKPLCRPTCMQHYLLFWFCCFTRNKWMMMIIIIM